MGSRFIPPGLLAFFLCGGLANAQVPGIPEAGLFEVSPDADGDGIPEYGVRLPDREDGTWTSVEVDGEVRHFSFGLFDTHLPIGPRLADLLPFAPLGFTIHSFGVLSLPNWWDDPLDPRGFLSGSLVNLATPPEPLELLAAYWSDVETKLDRIAACRGGRPLHQVWFFGSDLDPAWRADNPNAPNFIAVTWQNMFARDCQPESPTNTFQMLIIEGKDAEPARVQFRWAADGCGWATAEGDVGGRSGLLLKDAAIDLYGVFGDEPDGASLPGLSGNPTDIHEYCRLSNIPRERLRDDDGFVLRDEHGRIALAPARRGVHEFVFAADGRTLDEDSDGVPDDFDNCFGFPNPRQGNLDGDSHGDVCDLNADGDALHDSFDLCPRACSGSLADTDGDEQGDACDDDRDGDGVVDLLIIDAEVWLVDNCPTAPNPEQLDSNLDGIGDACVGDDAFVATPLGLPEALADCGGRPCVAVRIADPSLYWHEAPRDEDGQPYLDCWSDQDGDRVKPDVDNCLWDFNPLQLDFDQDSLGDVCDDDDDGDGVADDIDLCLMWPNPEQGDVDGDGIGDACDFDADADGLPNEVDNCPHVANLNQLDGDLDGLGDVCDDDLDNDGVNNSDDNCILDENADQRDTNENGLGDACDDDDDADLIPDTADNCQFTANQEQRDRDGDGVGDACEDDRDGDGVLDGDDNCVDEPNPAQGNTDGDAQGDFCDVDDDNDNVEDIRDNCQVVFNPDQANADGDTFGDACDPDQDPDGDGVADPADNCPGIPNFDQNDLDNDGEGDVCDEDRDGDSLDDEEDNCPSVANPSQEDADQNSIGDACEAFGAAKSAERTPSCATGDTSSTAWWCWLAIVGLWRRRSR